MSRRHEPCLAPNSLWNDFMIASSSTLSCGIVNLETAKLGVIKLGLRNSLRRRRWLIQLTFNTTQFNSIDALGLKHSVHALCCSEAFVAATRRTSCIFVCVRCAERCKAPQKFNISKCEREREDVFERWWKHPNRNFRQHFSQVLLRRSRFSLSCLPGILSAKMRPVAATRASEQHNAWTLLLKRPILFG